jgi:hypothetical protein
MAPCATDKTVLLSQTWWSSVMTALKPYDSAAEELLHADGEWHRDPGTRLGKD